MSAADILCAPVKRTRCVERCGSRCDDAIGKPRRHGSASRFAMDIAYRQAGQGSIDLADIHASLEFLNGSRYVRRGVIGLNGFSLGGRMALRVAAHAKVLAVSAIAARTSSQSNPTVLDEAGRLTSPILLQHGTSDSVVPYQDSVLLEKKLKSVRLTDRSRQPHRAARPLAFRPFPTPERLKAHAWHVSGTLVGPRRRAACRRCAVSL